MSKPVSILVIEDDPNTRWLLEDNLQNEGYGCTVAKDGEQGLLLFQGERFDLCIIDIMLPLKNGLEVGQHIRTLNPLIPIVFLTARSQHEHKIQGFQHGCDDYVTKPFQLSELLYRIKALLRRTTVKAAQYHEFYAGNEKIAYQPDERMLTVAGRSEKLSPKEGELLSILLGNVNAVVNREEILTRIWGADTKSTSASLDVYINKLRKKLAACAKCKLTTIYGNGIKLNIKEITEPLKT